MFKNKHFIVALIVAPILAIIAYLGIDIAVSEKPHAAKKGETYKLVSKSNCRYTSGLCDMENGDFKIQFRSETLSSDQLALSLKAAIPLQGIKVSLVDNQQDQASPIAMIASDDSAQQWQVSLPAPASQESWLRVAVQANDSVYYGDTQTAFVVYETLLNQDQE
ncbi:hypothetical protein [Vibrio agarivorans]|uniref:hypothetical protein n=1 Tax=Vibrio agarivorans TaxID=153622 RepID=UPI00222F915D|nr:hypothetical protein [Vibrio agarivorans]MDN3661802.1 hypothetical protein [Vibrio agarivorans]